jgi:hypothetical protein
MTTRKKAAPGDSATVAAANDSNDSTKSTKSFNASDVPSTLTGAEAAAPAKRRSAKKSTRKAGAAELHRPDEAGVDNEPKTDAANASRRKNIAFSIGVPTSTASFQAPAATAETLHEAQHPASAGLRAKPAAVLSEGRPPLRILALDGGPASYLAMLMLGQLETALPGFLANVDLIAGTSAGAISGLILATKDNPALMLPVVENFWLNGTKYYKNSLFGYLEALVGLGAVNDSKYVGRFLAQPGVLGTKLLKDLAKRVVVTSFDVNPSGMGQENPRMGAPSKGPLNWKAKIFHTFGCNDDGARPAVEVALSSSASPIVTPIHRGKVDGGLVANNPAMVALTQVMKELLHPVDTEAFQNRDGVVLLSVGSGRSQQVLKVNDANWGYIPWLLNPANLLLLVNAFLSASMDVVSVEALNMLHDDRFFRLDPFYVQPGLLPFVQADPKQQQATANAASTQVMVANATAWIKQSGWMRQPPPAPVTT